MAMEEITKLDKFTATPFRQEIELHHIDHEAGFSSLRIRIRELKRFTVFDIDEQTAEHWGRALLEWAETRKNGHGEPQEQPLAMTVSLSPNSLPEGCPLLNPLPSRRIEQLAANPGGDTPRGCEGEEANVKGACSDLRDEVSLRELHVNEGAPK